MSPSNEDLWISVIRLKFWKCFVPRVHTCPINLLTSDRSFLLQEVEEREEPLAGATLTNFQLQTPKRQSFQGLKGDSRRPSTVSKSLLSNLSPPSVCDKWRILSTLPPVTRYLELERVTVHHYAWRATMKNYRVERMKNYQSITSTLKCSFWNFGKNISTLFFIFFLFFFFSRINFTRDKLTLNYRRVDTWFFWDF